jgi:hypothetical protein
LFFVIQIGFAITIPENQLYSSVYDVNDVLSATEKHN